MASHRGRYFSFDNFTLVPRSVQRPHPPIRIAASQPDTYGAIGALGYPLFSALRASPLDDLAAHELAAALLSGSHATVQIGGNEVRQTGGVLIHPADRSALCGDGDGRDRS